MTTGNQEGCANSYQKRRDLLHKHFDPVFVRLDELEQAQFEATVASGVSPRASLGWPAVDAEVSELMRRFQSAATPQDYRDVGNRCVAVLEAVGEVVYDAEKHLQDGETLPARDESKKRLERYVECSLAGKENAKIRAVVRPVIELAHSVKHRPTPTRRDAGIVADATVLLAHILRRAEQDL